MKSLDTASFADKTITTQRTNSSDSKSFTSLATAIGTHYETLTKPFQMPYECESLSLSINIYIYIYVLIHILIYTCITYIHV